jgi:Xaa-Pro aminopeptidase
LHYIENNQQCHAGDLILLDVGAEYANYSSDMTRMVPVSGRFSDRQKEVYNAVLRVKNEAVVESRPRRSGSEQGRSFAAGVESEGKKGCVCDVGPPGGP